MSYTKSKNVYIAAASSELGRASHMCELLVQGGLVSTSTWIDELKASAPNPPDTKERIRRAHLDRRDVDRSDILWFLLPELPNHTNGGWWEFGYAYAQNKYIVTSIVNPVKLADANVCVFSALSDHCVSDLQALMTIMRLAREGYTETPREQMERMYSEFLCV